MIVSATLFLGFAVFVYTNDNKYTDDSLQPISGILSLSQEDVQGDFFFLTNGWQYFSQQTLTPEDFEEGMPPTPMKFVTIGQHNNFLSNTQYQSPYGAASYRLILDLPKTRQTYTLYLPEIYSAYNLYIDDALAIHMGDPWGEDIEIGKQSVYFSASGRTELLITVVNNNHYYGGMTFPPVFGLSGEVARWQDKTLSLHIFLMVLIITVALFALYFSIKLGNKSVLLLSLLAFLLFIQSIYPVYLHFFTVQNQLFYAVELFSIYAIYLVIIKLQYQFLNGNTVGYKLMSSALLVFCCFAFLYGITSFDVPIIHQVFSTLVTGVKWCIAIYLVINTIYGAYCEESGVLLVAMFTGIIPVALFADRLFSFYEPIYGSFFTEYSGLITILLGVGYTSVNLAEAYHFKVTFSEEKRILTRQVDIQKSQYLAVSEKIEETKKQRHDLRHHFKTIYLYLMEGQIEKAVEYLGEQGVVWEHDDKLSLCENIVADALLQYYKKLCDELHIGFSVSITMPNDIPIEDSDISILFGNLLENAYHACLTTDHPWVKIIGHYSDDCFMLQIENTFSSEIRKKGERLYSSKHGGFGIGTASAKAVTEKYNGFTSFDDDYGIFTASMTLQFQSDPMDSSHCNLL